MARGAVKAPDAAFVRQRWISKRVVDQVLAAGDILTEHGAVQGTETYDVRHKARWRAQQLIRYMVELRMHERWELKEHTEQNGDGRWTWAVEYLGGPRNGS